MIFDYFDQVGEGIEFLIALGSIMGVLGFIIGLIFFIFGGRMRYKMTGVMIVSIILLAICGLSTGFKYFRIHI
jgi:hypothetical protein